MDMLGLIIWLAVIIIGGGGAGIWVFKGTRKKNRSWTAKVYQLSEGTRLYKDSSGKIIESIKLQDLRPYTKDQLILTEKEHGVKVCYLKNLDLTCRHVTSDDVEVWGKGDKEVSVLVSGDTATILRKGYDSKSGQILFTPMPRERIDLMKSEILLKKDRLKDNKNWIEKMVPYVVIAISLISIVAIAYFNGESYIKTSKNFKTLVDDQSDRYLEIAKVFRDGAENLGDSINSASNVNNQKNPEMTLGEQKINKSKPPSIE